MESSRWFKMAFQGRSPPEKKCETFTVTGLYTVQRLREGSVSVVCNCFLSGGCFWLLDSFLCPTFVMSDYDIRPGGSLKLKGGVTEGGIVKK